MGQGAEARPCGVNRRPTGSGWLRPARLLAAWIALLGLVGVAAAAAPASAWPDWNGTPPDSLSANLPAYGLHPVIASGPDGWMVAAWSNPPSEGAQHDIYVRLSTDYGVTWSPPVRAAETPQGSWLPGAALIGGEVSVVWIEYSAGGEPAASEEPAAVYEARRTSSGTWETPRVIPSPPLGGFSDQVRIASGGGRLHLVFSVWDNANQQDDIFYAARPLTATTWPTATRVTQALVRECHPDVAVSPDGQTVHVVWERYRGIGAKAVMYASAALSSGEVTWSPPYTLSTAVPRSVWPVIAAGPGDELHVAWGEEVAGEDGMVNHYVRYTHYDGSTWSTPQRISATPVHINQIYPYYIIPRIALYTAAGGAATVCVAWHGYPQEAGVSQAEEVVMSCAPAGTASWSAPRRISRSDEILSILPSIAFDARGHLHAVWQEHTGSEDLIENYQVYHARELTRLFLPLVMRGGIW